MTETTVANEPPAKRSPSRALLALMLVVLFGVGMLAGITVDRMFLHHRHGPFAGMGPGRGGPGDSPEHRAEMHRRLADRIARDLDLTPEQRQQFEAMLPRHEAAFDSLRLEMDARLRTLLDSSTAEVERILTPEQKTKWEGIRRRFHAPGGPPPPQ
jgi:Spy/CpxP family protein refolding chaperone